MERKELFQIGDVAKMYHISVGTLRHYEKIGLLKPEYIDDKTGYNSLRMLSFQSLIRLKLYRQNPAGLHGYETIFP